MTTDIRTAALPQGEAGDFPARWIAVGPGIVAVALATAGVLAAGLTAWAVASSEIIERPGSTAVVRALIVASYVALGTYTWWRRRDSRLGPLVVGLGFLFALTSLGTFAEPLAFTLGRLALAGTVVYLTYVFLCFPRDRLGSNVERWYFRGLVAVTVVLWAATLALSEELPIGGALTDCGDRCPSNAFQLAMAPDAATTALDVLSQAARAIGLIGVAVLLVRKARTPLRLRRRAVAPLLYAAVALIVSYVAFGVLSRTDAGTALPWATTAITALAIPALMFVGELRGRVFAASSLGRIAAKVGEEPVSPERVQGLLREALGDPSLQLALWEPAQSSYLDVAGARIQLPRDPLDRMVTPIARDGRPFAALIHDPALDSSAGFVEGVASTSLLLLENSQLVEELRASRARIVATAQQERMRMERDLHDGAQQRLLAIQLKLGLARNGVGDDERTMLLEEIEEDAALAVGELRSLAHGIYPTVLRERGVADGLRSMAIAAAVPVRIVDRGIGRCAPEIEAAIYFSALEAVQNAVKHGGRGAEISITLERWSDEVAFTVHDDGVGFDSAVVGDGIGIVSIRDRVGAVGGTLEINSAPGQGTTVRGVISA